MEERLDAARHELFVGREAELATIDELLRPESPLRFVYFEGPGGVGKTELLHAAARVARKRGYNVRWIDARSRLWTEQDLAEVLSVNDSNRWLVALDGFETLASLEDALRLRILPQLPDSARVVGGGRMRLGAAWSTDSGWRSIATSRRLGPLSFEEASTYLRRRSVPDTHVAPLADEARGLPLALALLADSSKKLDGAPPRLDAHLPVVTTLADQWLEGLPHDVIIGVQACAIALYATEEVLCDILDVADARATFDDLRRRAFVDSHPHGLVLHDIVRAAVLADMSWRHPERRRTFLRRAAQHLLDSWPASLADHSPTETRRIVHLLCQAEGYPGSPYHRDDLYCEVASPSDWPILDEICLEHEGPESLHWLRYWRARGSTMIVCRTQDGRIVGFRNRVEIDKASWEDVEPDPATRGLWQRWEKNGLRAAGKCALDRHWMSADDHQFVSAVQNELFFSIAYGLFTGADRTLADVVIDRAYWKRFEFKGITPEQQPDLEFEMDGRRSGIQVWEMIGRTPSSALRKMLEFMLGMSTASPPQPATLDRHAFGDAVRQALRLADRPDLVAASPLCRALVSATSATGTTERGQELCALMRSECEQLFSSTRDRDVHRVLVHTYFEPIGKQELVAAELGLSFGTYRRHLAGGTRRIVDALWTHYEKSTT